MSYCKCLIRSSTFSPLSAKHRARVMAVVVLPTPPRWLDIVSSAGPTAHDAWSVARDDPRSEAFSRRLAARALAHAQVSKDKEKFILPLKEYRRAVDLVLTVRRLEA